MTFQLTPTLSILEVLWIASCLLGLWYGRKNLWESWLDRQAQDADLELRAVANMWLLIFSYFAWKSLVFLAVGVLAAFNPPGPGGPASPSALLFTFALLSLQIFAVVLQGIIGKQRDYLTRLIVRRIRGDDSNG